jgi:hypothetical protein
LIKVIDDVVGVHSHIYTTWKHVRHGEKRKVRYEEMGPNQYTNTNHNASEYNATKTMKRYIFNRHGATKTH